MLIGTKPSTDDDRPLRTSHSVPFNLTLSVTLSLFSHMYKHRTQLALILSYFVMALGQGPTRRSLRNDIDANLMAYELESKVYHYFSKRINMEILHRI